VTCTPDGGRIIAKSFWADKGFKVDKNVSMDAGQETCIHQEGSEDPHQTWNITCHLNWILVSVQIGFFSKTTSPFSTDCALRYQLDVGLF
jgi:hypothetical protein